MNKEIFRLAIPNVISNLSIPFLSTVDTILMGQLSTKHLAAVGIATMIFNFFYWNFGFLRMGTTGMTAQAFGKKDKKAYSQILFQSLLMAMIIAVILLVFNQYVLNSSAYFLNIGSGYYPYVNDYFKIRIIAAPATLGLYALMGWYFGMQNAWIPMIVTIIINVLNIITSLFFVKYFNMGVEGVAWGTVISQYIGLLLSFAFLYQYKQKIQYTRLKNILELHSLKRFLNINKDIFIRTICLTFAFAFFYSQSAKNGETTLAVMVLLLQFLNWMSYFIDGFAYAAESLVGKYFGAQNKEKLEQSIQYSIKWGFFLAILFSILYYVMGGNILSLFSNDKTVISAAQKLMIWTVIMPLAGFLSYIWDGIFIGLTATSAMRNSMFISLIIYMALFYLIPINTLDWYWVAFLIFLLSRGVVQSLQYFMIIRKQIA